MTYEELLEELRGWSISLDERVQSDVTGDDSYALSFELIIEDPKALLEYTHPEVNEETPEDQVPTRDEVIEAFPNLYEFEAPVADYRLSARLA